MKTTIKSCCWMWKITTKKSTKWIGRQKNVRETQNLWKTVEHLTISRREVAGKNRCCSHMLNTIATSQSSSTPIKFTVKRIGSLLTWPYKCDYTKMELFRWVFLWCAGNLHRHTHCAIQWIVRVFVYSILAVSVWQALHLHVLTRLMLTADCTWLQSIYIYMCRNNYICVRAICSSHAILLPRPHTYLPSLFHLSLHVVGSSRGW